MKWEYFVLIPILSTSLMLGGCATAPYDKWAREVKFVPKSQPPLPEGISRKKPTDPPSFFQIGCKGEWEPENGMWVCISPPPSATQPTFSGSGIPCYGYPFGYMPYGGFYPFMWGPPFMMAPWYGTRFC